YSESSEGNDDEHYWLQRFSGSVPVLELPIDRHRPPVKTYASKRIDHPLGADLVQELRKAGAKSGCSLFVTLLTSFQVFLHRITGQEDLVVGVPAAGQSALGMEDLVGHCVNLLPIRTSIRSTSTGTEVLQANRPIALDAFEH